MGQQQLKLVIFGIVVMGIVIGFANQLFDVSPEDSNKESITSELMNLSTIAQQYFNRPVAMGGGGDNFTGWQIPGQLDSTSSGIYNISQKNNNQLILNGFPFQEKGYTWYVRSTITKSEFVTEIINIADPNT